MGILGWILVTGAFFVGVWLINMLFWWIGYWLGDYAGWFLIALLVFIGAGTYVFTKNILATILIPILFWLMLGILGNGLGAGMQAQGMVNAAKQQPKQAVPMPSESVDSSSDTAEEQGFKQWKKEQPSAPPSGWLPDASTPVLNIWQTSWGFSFLGILAAAILSSISLDVVLILFVLSIIYAAVVYPSFFGDRPKLTSNKVISAANLMFGGYIFGAIWNGNLTRRKKGISHIVFIVLSILIVISIASDLITRIPTSSSSTSGSHSGYSDSMRNQMTPTKPPLEVAPIKPKPAPQIPSGAIKWTEAPHLQIGKSVSIYGTVEKTEYAPQSEGQPTFIDIGAPYPDPRRVSVVIEGRDRGKFPSTPESLYLGKVVCVTGIAQYRYGAACKIKVKSPSQIQVIE